MDIQDCAALFFKASQEHKCCRILLRSEPLARTIHPYGICTTSKNQIVLVCWQTAGFTKAGGKEGYRNLQLDKIIELEMLETNFRKRDDFNADDGQYKEWVYHI